MMGASSDTINGFVHIEGKEGDHLQLVSRKVDDHEVGV